jgi:hypothetical protein
MSEPKTQIFAPVHAGRIGLYVLLGGLAAVVLLVVWTGISMLLVPRISYAIEVDRLLIWDSTGSRATAKVVMISKIWDASPVLLRGRERRMATEKPGYCVGLFYFGGFGEAWLASNCSNRAVALKTSGELAPIVVTPPDGTAFIKALWAGGKATFEAPRNLEGTAAVTVALLLFLLGLGGGLVAALLIAPRRLRYEVSAGQLVVRTFRGQFRVPLAGARVKLHRPLHGDRLSGVNIPGYWVGSWTLDNMATSVACSAKEDGVMLEGDGRLFLTPQDRQGFVDALVAAGATLTSATLQRRF